MRKIRNVLRMRHANGLSQRAIAQSLGVSKGSVDNYLRRAQVAGLGWPLPEELSDAALYAKLFPPARVPEAGRRPEPDWASVYQELRKPGVTLRLLWEEYRANHPDGYGQSRFYGLYRAWAGRLAPRMRQTHLAGERLFVDFAGQTMPIVDPHTGEVHAAQIFVAVLGASSYTYAQATWTQQLPDWCAAHVRAFAFFGGVANLLVSDNLKSGVAKACFYEARPNSTYAELATHYGTVIHPARPRRPRDKSKVEVGVQVVERWVLARLRKRTFSSLAALNAAIAELVTDLNARTTRHLGTSRRALFDSLEAPALKPLPAAPYAYAEWREAGVGLDYHVEVDRHFYSVPSSLLRERVTVRVTAASVEIFHKGKRVAAHARSPASRRHTTLAEHMPSSHRRYAEWTPERLQRQADRIGPNAGALVAVILRDKPHPEQGFRACLGILRLARSYGEPRLEAACARAIEIGARSYSRSARSSRTTSIVTPRSRPRRARRSTTPTSAAPAITTEEISMLTHPTVEQMHELGLRGMARAFQEMQANPEAEALTHADWLALLLDREAADRRDRRLKTRLRSAKLRFSQACVEDVDHRTPRGLDRALVQQLAGGGWITQHENLLITGPSGVGKSWLACALGQRACRDNITVLYKRLPRLFSELAMGRGDGRHERLMRAMAKANLLILDDWGPEPLTGVQRREILEILEDRYGAGSTIVTSQLPVEQWHEVVGDPTLADAILDRLVHNAHRLELKGASMRKRMATITDAETP